MFLLNVHYYLQRHSQLTYLTKLPGVTKGTRAVAVIVAACPSVQTASFTCKGTHDSASLVSMKPTSSCCSSPWQQTHSSWSHRTFPHSHPDNHTHRCCKDHRRNGSILHHSSTVVDRWLQWDGTHASITQRLTYTICDSNRNGELNSSNKIVTNFTSVWLLHTSRHCFTAFMYVHNLTCITCITCIPYTSHTHMHTHTHTHTCTHTQHSTTWLWGAYN